MLQSFLSTTLPLAPTPPPQAPADALFSPANGPLTIELNEDGDSINHYDLLRLYGELTGQHVAYGHETKQVTQNQLVRLDRSITVAANDVQLLVESPLRRADFALFPPMASGVHIVEVTSLATSARNSLRSKARYTPRASSTSPEGIPPSSS